MAGVRAKKRDSQVRLFGVPLSPAPPRPSLASVRDPSFVANAKKRKRDSQELEVPLPLAPLWPSPAPPMLSPTPPRLSHVPPMLSAVPPRLSPTPPRQSPAPTQLSHVPLMLSAEPPRLSPAPQRLSPTLQHLSPAPPRLPSMLSQRLSLTSGRDPSIMIGAEKRKRESQVLLLRLPLLPAPPRLWHAPQRLLPAPQMLSLAPSSLSLAPSRLSPVPQSLSVASVRELSIMEAPTRLSLNSTTIHESENSNELQLGFSPKLYSSLEQYLPLSLSLSSHDVRADYMRALLLKYVTEGKHQHVLSHKAYRQDILSKYKPKHRELYRMHAESFFVPSFLQAITDNTEESFRSITKEQFPGIYAFEMLQPHICDLFLSEIENIEKWVVESETNIMRPNTMNKYGAVLDDFGFNVMLDKLLNDFIRPISGVFFPDVGGSMLDSRHGFVVEYGVRRDFDLGLHVDDSEVTLNVCLGNQFTGGELYFRGVRCDKHVNTGTFSEEVFDYINRPGTAILHRGRHRHGARATTSGQRANLIIWCRSAVFRQMKKYQNDFSAWCGECQMEKKERQESQISAAKLELMRRLGNLAH